MIPSGLILVPTRCIVLRSVEECEELSPSLNGISGIGQSECSARLKHERKLIPADRLGARLDVSPITAWLKIVKQHSNEKDLLW